MTASKAIRAQARKMNQMARMMELSELSKSSDPKALQNFLVKEATRKVTNQVRAKLRRTITKSFGL